MRNTLLTLTALVGLLGAGTAASASPRLEAPFASVQTVQYYGGYGSPAQFEGHRDWRREEWRRREWERRRREEEWHRHHGGYGR